MTDAVYLMKVVTMAAERPEAKALLDELLSHHAKTYYHSIHVALLSVQIADLIGLTGDRLFAVATGALLHDVGKLDLSPAILDKTGPLTQKEFSAVRNHPLFSYDRIMQTKAFGNPIIPLIGLMHHMRLDGSGYPEEKKLPPGVIPKIPTEAQVVSVADVYEAIVSPRSYKDSFSDLFAISELYKDVVAGRMHVRFVSALDSLVNEQTLIVMHGGYRATSLAV